jgi:N-acetyl-D-muramate 6-phosphate phosphatase
LQHTTLLPLPKAILFDFDGTFADTAPDMAFVANMLRVARGMDTLPLLDYRPHVSRGARGMVAVAFGVSPEDIEFAALRDEFLNVYEKNLCVYSTLFENMNETLAFLERHHIKWGIVTNKARRFTDPLVKLMGLDIRTPCIVSGDTTPHAKPHPAPLLHAADILDIAPSECWYVGDDERDIHAAHAADMVGIVASYGYLGGTDPSTWGADASIDSPLDLVTLLQSTMTKPQTAPHSVTN